MFYNIYIAHCRETWVNINHRLKSIAFTSGLSGILEQILSTNVQLAGLVYCGEMPKVDRFSV